MIPFGPWEPDKGAFSDTSIDVATNVTPIANGWGPFKSLSDVSQSLAAQCYGGCYGRASDGSYFVIAGTATRLYKLNTVDYSWTDYSGPSAPYSVPTGQMWQFERFGTNLYAVALDTAPQYLDVDVGSAFADVTGSPPKAKYIRTIGDFLFLGYLKVGATEYPNKWANSALNDATVWTVGTKFADEQVIPDGDEIMGIVAARGGGRILQRRAKRSIVLTPDVQLPIVSQGIDLTRGVVAPLAIVPIGDDDYVYLNEDGFYRGDGHAPIGAERVNRYFFADVNLDRLEEVQGAADPYNKMVWWRYQDGSNVYKMIGYDWQLDRWARSDTPAQVLLASVTAGYTLEALDAISSSIDALTESLDSRRFKGGRPTFGAFTATANKLGVFTGTNAEATIETSTQAFAAPLRSFVSGVRSIGDAPSFTIAVGKSPNHQTTISFDAAASPNSSTGVAPARASGYLHRIRQVISAAVVWNVLHGVDPVVQPEGQR